ncbi:MAG: CDP-diacylglycerol--glycerol-3-phosphate 3-phosphatidyltransferase [Planctomycetota bacterium]
MAVPREWLNLPNKITLARLIIALMLFVMLSVERQTGALGDRIALNLACVIFVICVATDWIDGYIARKYQMVTTLGRIADPFVDKVVVCGAFVYLIDLTEIIRPWFAVTIIAREFLVTSLRSYMESQGVPFGARLGGKIKMVAQSVAIPVVLFYQANLANSEDETTWKAIFYWLSWTLVWVTLVTTITSAWDYVRVAIRTHCESAAEESVR